MHDEALIGMVQPMLVAFLENDPQRVADLVRTNSATLVARVEDLAVVPDEFRTDDELLQMWGTFVLHVAHLLAEDGHDALLLRLTASADDPIERWWSAVQLADRLKRERRYADSNAILAPVVEELRASRGSAVDEIRGKAIGMLGANAFNLGDLGSALSLTDEALRECERLNDEEGVRIYSENLASLRAAMDQDGESSLVRRSLARAQTLHDAGRLGEALTLVQSVVANLTPESEFYHAKAFGLLGMVAYRLGDPVLAEDATRRAIDAGRANTDHNAVKIYEANLAVIARDRPAPPHGWLRRRLGLTD
jgi:tetratricopeptide (TPR) repeat protein